MTITQVRNPVVELLAAHIGCPVVLSDQTSDVPGYPYCYYSILAPRMTTHAFGLKIIKDGPGGPVMTRSEPVNASMSFTFCSQNRRTEDGKYIFGEDEALEIVEKAHGFFLLNGHNIPTEYGDIVVREVGKVASRTGFLVEDTVRRYGFDVKLGYVRTDEMPVLTIECPGNPHGYNKHTNEELDKWQKT